MEINNSFSAQQSGVQQLNNRGAVNNRDASRAQQEQRTQNDREQTRTQQTRFDVDQQAIAQVEQFDQQRNVGNEQTTNSGYDQPPAQNQSAVQAYQAVDNQSQRETIQQTFGVDLYA